MPPKNPVTATPVEEKLDEIVLHLKRLDRRDRMRTIGGFIRGFLALIPLLLLLWSVWYFVQHGDEIMKKIADQAASSAAEFTQQKGQGLLDQLKKEYSFPNK